MGLFQTLFSFSGRINKKRFFWATSFIALPSLVVYLYMLSIFVGFGNLMSIKPGSETAVTFSWVVMIQMGITNFIHAALMFKRINDTKQSDTYSWVYAGLLGLSVYLASSDAYQGDITGSATLGLTNLVIWGMWFKALYQKSSPAADNASRNTAFEYGGKNVPVDIATIDSNEEADAIIARAIAERRLAQEATNRKAVMNPAPTRRTQPVAFGNRPKTGFGQRC